VSGTVTVGYAQNALQNGATMVAPQFLTVGSSTLSLDDIVPQGDNLDDVNIQLLTSAGLTSVTYYWNTYMYETPRWVDDSMVEVTGVTFSPGQGLWVGASDSTQSLQAAGEVGLSDVAIALQNGATATGNPFPVAVNLADVYPTGDNLDDVNIQLLTSAGLTSVTYYWNTYMYETPRWVDDSMVEVTDVSFPAGQGLWVGASDSSQYLNFPAPEL